MKHYIIVKFKEQINAGSLTAPVTELFRKLTEMDGIYDINIHTSCIDCPNRYDLMIEIIWIKTPSTAMTVPKFIRNGNRHIRI